jgi:hypothetical protein
MHIQFILPMLLARDVRFNAFAEWQRAYPNPKRDRLLI